MTTETEYQDHRVTLPFSVPAGDTEGALTEALFDAAIDLAPSEATGFVASADTHEGKVWIVFTLPDSSEDFARNVARELRVRIKDAVLTGDDACITSL